MIGSTSRFSTGALSLVLLATTAAAAQKPRIPAWPAPGFPKLTDTTRQSDLPLASEQAAVTFDHADLAIEVLPATHRIRGVATLRFTPDRPLASMVVDLDPNLPVTAIAVDGTIVSRARWSNPQGRLRVALPSPAAAGRPFSVKITYSGAPHVAVKAPWDGGFVWAKTDKGKPWIATAVQGEGCDLFWPCIDSPQKEPARVDLHITVPAGLSAPANGILMSTDTHADGRRTFNWQIKQPNLYGIALNVGPYKLIEAPYRSRYGNSFPMQYWHLEGHEKDAAALFAQFAPTLDFFETMIGPYPFGSEKMGVVETPHLGMEHQTINAYGNAYKQDVRGFDWLFQHEFSHEWFGNQMTNANADDMWLHEGYGSYMQPLYGQWRTGDASYYYQLQTSAATIANDRPLVSGRPRAVEDVYDSKTGPGGDIYVKGAWLLHTLRNLIGDKDFFAVTRRAVYGRDDPKPGNFRPLLLSSTQYQAIVNDVTGKDHGWFFDVYLRQAALPDLVQTRRGDRIDLRWAVPGGRPFPMPVEVKVADRTYELAMKDGTGSVPAPPGAHILIDPQSRILRRSTDLESLKAWRKTEEVRKKKEVTK